MLLNPVRPKPTAYVSHLYMVETSSYILYVQIQRSMMHTYMYWS